MTELSHIDRLVAKESITELKARYFRFVDTKQWALLAAIFTSDCTFHFEGVSAGQASAYSSVTDFIRGVEQMLSGAVSIHHGYMPEIEVIDAHSATGTWQMTDFVQRAASNPLPSFKGYGHYHETYRYEGQWLISSVSLSRLLRIDLPRPAPDGGFSIDDPPVAGLST